MVVRHGTWLENPFPVLQPFLFSLRMRKSTRKTHGMCVFQKRKGILRVPFRKVVIQFSSFFGVFDILCGITVSFLLLCLHFFSPIFRQIEHRRIEGICRLQRPVVAEIIGCLADALTQGKS